MTIKLTVTIDVVEAMLREKYNLKKVNWMIGGDHGELTEHFQPPVAIEGEVVE